MIELVDVTAAQEAAGHAMACVKVIRQWLPGEGLETLSSERTQDDWHNTACRQCFEFTRWHASPGRYHTVGPEQFGKLWRELCDGMVDIRTHYGWDDIDFKNRLPHAGVRGGQQLPPIPERLLRRVEVAAAAIAIEYARRPWEERFAAFHKRHFDGKTWTHAKIAEAFAETLNEADRTKIASRTKTQTVVQFLKREGGKLKSRT